MNNKANAITLDILIMLVILAVVLGFTSFYIDQVMLRPIIQMNDQEASLKCSLLLSQLLKGGYLRQGEIVDSDSLKESLIQTYNVTNENNINFGRYTENYQEALKALYGKDAVLIIESEYLFNLVAGKNNLFGKQFSPVCYTMVYGPINTGVAAIFNQEGVKEEFDRQRNN